MKLSFIKFALTILIMITAGSVLLLVAQEAIPGSSITIVGHDHGECGDNCIRFSVSLPDNIQEGDVSIMFLGRSDNEALTPPSGWTSFVRKGPADINQKAAYKVHVLGDEQRFTFDEEKSFVQVVTLRHVNQQQPIKDFWSGKDTDRGGEEYCIGKGKNYHLGKAKATDKLSTANGGVRLVSCMFDDPFVGEVYKDEKYNKKAMIVLGAYVTGGDGDGLMLAIEGTNGNLTEDRYIRGRECERGGGNDVVFSIIINPKQSQSPPPGKDVIVDMCESVDGWKNSSRNSLEQNNTRKEGSYSIKSTGNGTDDFRKKFDNPIAANGANTLEFWYFVSETSRLDASNQVELGSAGKPDQNEYNWSLSRSNDLESNAWVKIILPFAAAKITRGRPNLNALNWFRLYRRKKGIVTSRIDDIRLTTKISSRTTQTTVELEQVQNFQVAPNPTKGYFKVYLNNTKDPVTIQLLDLQGRLVLQERSNQLVTSFDVSHLKKGIYVLKIANKAGSKTIRLVIE